MQRLSDPGELITGSWENFVRNFRTYLDFAVWFLLLSVIQWGLTVAVAATFSDVLMRNVVLSIVTLPVAIASLAVLASLIDATCQGVQGKPVNPRASFSHGLHRLVPFIIILVLTSLVYLFGMLLFVLPLFLFAVWFWFSPFYAIIDEQHGLAAMRASKKLTSGRWWSVAIRLLLPAVFYVVAAEFVRRLLTLALGIVLGDPATFFDTYALTENVSNMQLLIMALVPAVINAFLLPLLYGSYLLLWLDLKRTR